MPTLVLVFFLLIKLLSFRAAAPPLSGLGLKMKKPWLANTNRGCGRNNADKESQPLAGLPVQSSGLMVRVTPKGTTTTTTRPLFCMREVEVVVDAASQGGLQSLRSSWTPTNFRLHGCTGYPSFTTRIWDPSYLACLCIGHPTCYHG